jgi:enterochelin esterase-like enzyme
MMRVHFIVWISLTCLAVACAAPPASNQALAPRIALATPTLASPCEIVRTLAPDREAIPPPKSIPIPTVLPQTSARSDLVEFKFFSPLLDKEMPALVYLPPGYYNTQRRYPVLYMLSGFAGDYREWATYGLCEIADALMRGGVVQPMIIVMPEGEKSWWFNHAPVEGSDGKPYGDYVWRDVVGFADETLRTLPQRSSRAIGGLSSGGQAALMLALTHPEIFSVAGAHSPSIRGADGSLPIFGTPDYFKQYDPLWLMQNRDSWRQISIWIDRGREDTQWGTAITHLHSTMNALGVAHEFQDQWAGKHEADYWSAHLSDYLKWYASKLSGE